MSFVMFKKYWLLALFLTLPHHAGASYLDKLDEKDLLAKLNQRRIDLSDEILSFLPDGIKDCQKIVDPKTGRNGLCGISLIYYELIIAKMAEKDTFINDSSIVNSRKEQFLILLLPSSGEARHRINVESLQTLLFNNNLFDMDALRQISLSLLSHYFRLMLEVNYLDFGKKNIKNFMDPNLLDQHCQRYRRTQLLKRKAFPELVDTRDLHDPQNIYDGVFSECMGNVYSNNNTIFEMAIGISPLYYLTKNPGKNIYLPEVDFTLDYESSDEKKLLLKKYYTLMATELYYFSIKFVTKELDLIAPLPDTSFRKKFIDQQIITNQFHVGSNRIAMDNNTLSLENVSNDRLMQARYACIAAEKEVVPLKEHIKLLEATVQQLEDKNAQFASDHACRELLEDELSGKKGRQKMKGKVAAKTADLQDPIVTQLKKDNRDLRKANSKLNTLMQELSDQINMKNSKLNTQMDNAAQFIQLYNSTLSTHEEMKRQLDELQRDLGDLHELVQVTQLEKEDLLSKNQGLRGAIKLLSSSYREMREENESMKNNIEILSKIAHEHSEMLAASEPTNAELKQDAERFYQDNCVLHQHNVFLQQQCIQMQYQIANLWATINAQPKNVKPADINNETTKDKGEGK